MHAIKKNISLVAVIITYLFFNFRYSPESFADSIKSTLIQLLLTSPFDPPANVFPGTGWQEFIVPLVS